MSEAKHIDIWGQPVSGMDNKSPNKNLGGVHLQPVQNTGYTSEKEQQPDPRVLQTKPLQESSRILDFDYTVSFGEQLSGNENIASKTVEYQNLLSVADGQYQPTECTHFATQSVTDEKECFILDELMTDYPPGFEVPQSVAVEKECSSIKDTITDYPPGFEINTVQDATNEPGQPNTIASNLTEVEQLENLSGLEQNTLGQSDAGLGHGMHTTLDEEDIPVTHLENVSKDVVVHHEWSSIIENFPEFPPGFGDETMHDVVHQSGLAKDLVDDFKSDVEQTAPSVELQGEQFRDLSGYGDETMHDVVHKPGQAKDLVEGLKSDVEQTGPSMDLQGEQPLEQPGSGDETMHDVVHKPGQVKDLVVEGFKSDVEQTGPSLDHQGEHSVEHASKRCVKIEQLGSGAEQTGPSRKQPHEQPGFNVDTMHDEVPKPGHAKDVVGDLKSDVEQTRPSMDLQGEQTHEQPGFGDETMRNVFDKPGFNVDTMHDEVPKPGQANDVVGDLKSDVEQTRPSMDLQGEQPHEQPGVGDETMHNVFDKPGCAKDLVEVFKSDVELAGPSMDLQAEQPQECVSVSCVKIEQVGSVSEPVAEDLNIILVDTGRGSASEPTGTSMDFQGEQPPEHVSTSCVQIEQLGSASEPAAEDLNIHPATGHEDKVANSLTMSEKKDTDHSGRRKKRTPHTKVKSKYSLRSSESSTKLPQSNSEPKPKDQNQVNDVGNATDSGRKKRARKKRIERKSHDEFSRTRVHLRYLLHRMKYDLNLLEAYSSEGWRGQSLEKLRPEKELERAKADINRYKSKIRSLFQHLDSVCAEGRFPDSLYDSDGLIDSEDIYCAKCGSKELTADNDIILCDGACDRGFHQFCLDPPLRTEEIPPGDLGWLCPACDCKVDCIDLLNDYHVKRLSVGDVWEKVFPEAATAVSGNVQDDDLVLPSDDSDDNDYDPDKADNDDGNDDKVEGSGSSSDESGSSSDESDFSSASEDLGAVCGVQQDLGLPSDDSDDDDFDPDAPDMDEQDKQEMSSSDFSSASEDLGAANDTEVSGKDVEPQSVPEPDYHGDDEGRISARRQVERLDYKKLYEETYGNASSDSSDDDEEWKDTSDTTKAGTVVKIKNTRGRRKICWSPAPRGAENPQAQLNKTSPKATIGSKSEEKGSSRRLGDEATRRLHASFKENQYPDRTTKENLANELGLTLHQVQKWFDNARWSFNHPSQGGASTPQSASRHGGINQSKGEASTLARKNQPKGEASTPARKHQSKGEASTPNKNQLKGEVSTPGSASKGRGGNNHPKGEASAPGSASKGPGGNNQPKGEASAPGSASKGRGGNNQPKGEASAPVSVAKGRAKKNPSQGEASTPGSASEGHGKKNPSQGQKTSVPGSASKHRGKKQKSEHKNEPDLSENVACNGSGRRSTRASAAVKQHGGTDSKVTDSDIGKSSTKQSIQKQSRKRKNDDVEDREIVVALPLRADKSQAQDIPEVGLSHSVETKRGRPARRRKSDA